VNRILPFKKESGLFNDKEPGWRGESEVAGTETGICKITGDPDWFFFQTTIVRHKKGKPDKMAECIPDRLLSKSKPRGGTHIRSSEKDFRKSGNFFP
jgi:hypothetical protein